MKPAWKALHIIFIIVFLVGKADCQTLTRLGNYSGTVGNYSTYIGFGSGEAAYGTFNTFLGSFTGVYNEGTRNIFIGSYAGSDSWGGSNNVFLGYNAGFTNEGSNNTFIGYHAGENWNYSSGSNNVFIGNYAGANEEGSHKLYIANTSTSMPLIYGEFDNKKLSVNGKLGVGTMSPTAKLHIQNTGTPFAQYNTLEAYGNTDVGYSVLRLHSTHAAVNDRYLMTATQMSNTHFSILMDGKVGIGTASPAAKLHINNGASTDAAVLATSTEDNKLIVSSGVTSPAYISTFRITQEFGSNRNNGYISFHRGGDTGGGFLSFGSSGIERLRIEGNGNIGIGTLTPQYKLDVCGTIRAEEIKIDLNCSVPDFVFKKDYPLMDLKELEKFVQTNHHLPEIPSEKEMHENGMNMMELQLKLLQKIEELTLYTIAQEKMINKLEEKVELQGDILEKILK